MIDPSDPNLMPLLQTAAACLIESIPPEANSAVCSVHQSEGHAPGRLRYESEAAEIEPSPALHEAAYEIYRLSTRDSGPFTPFRISAHRESNGEFGLSFRLLHDKAAPPLASEQTDAAWQRVYSAREHFFTSHFGPLPPDIQKLRSLAAIWPGGGILAIEATQMNGLAVTTSFGLSNYDMPTTVQQVLHEQHGDTSSLQLQARVPRWVSPSLAGYGYEIAVITRELATWPLYVIAWFVQMEILKDLDLLARVDKYNGMTIQGIELGEDGEAGDFFVERARPPYPAGVELPNGRLNLLIATRITREEMEYSLERGRPALTQRLIDARVHQISDPDRKPVTP